MIPEILWCLVHKNYIPLSAQIRPYFFGYVVHICLASDPSMCDVVTSNVR